MENVFLIIIFFEIIVLFLLSKNVTKRVYLLFFHIFKSKKIAIYVYSVIFLPGTFVHELSHFLFALFLLVPVGEVDLVPTIEEGNVKLGSVAIGKTDLLRRVIIGLAPLLVGVSLIVTFLYQFSERGLLANPWALAILGYLVFQIGNSMFSSRKDLEGAVTLVSFLSISYIFLLFLASKFNLNLPPLTLTPSFVESLKVLSLLLLVPISVDLFTLLLFRLVD
ncbi:MAG: putative membrane protein [Candidatus Woesebacteria bacterium GW2011_GWA1_39_8]|jgi:hypothetical protein|uniref:Putative membrane protein n=1 Tax=Candidatus Woesebacteria bacterium GW2011_GWA1_39_8 TaxID=1618552 RepID=A0A0G0S5Z3_9BACT|nr:MAG: putative membrane protein [Candidatus Woesebacteria bacterium GW2011_GWA1_39_8]